MVSELEMGRNSAICRRLRQLRRATGQKTATEWAEMLGWSISKLSNYENGVPLSFPAAKRLRERIPGLTIDWLIYGDERGLSRTLKSRLREDLKAQKRLAKEHAVRKTA